jgi:hypothetical protein
MNDLSIMGVTEKDTACFSRFEGKIVFLFRMLFQVGNFTCQDFLWNFFRESLTGKLTQIMFTLKAYSNGLYQMNHLSLNQLKMLRDSALSLSDVFEVS